MPPALSGLQGQDQMNNIASLPEGYDQNPEMAGQPIKILAHFDPEELAELDEMQGGIIIDPETNLREYLQLDQILRDPKIRDEISLALSKQNQQPGFAEGGIVDEPGRPQDPELEQLRLRGRNGDTELAIITPELQEIFIEWSGREPDINPDTELPEFGWFKNILRIVAPVVGAFLGGPVGGALGGFLGGKLTGQSTGAALKGGLLGGALPFAAPFIGGALGSVGGALGGGAGSALGGLGNAISGLGTSGAGGMFGNIGNLFGSAGSAGTGSGLVSNLSGVGKMLPGAGQMAAQATQAGLQGGAPGGMPTAAGQQGGGILGSLVGGIGKALPLVGAGLMLNKGHQDENKQIRDYEKERRAENEAERERYGFNEPLRKRTPQDLEATNTPISREDYESGSIPRFFRASGGAIRGEGKGQEDNIKKDIKENSYIIDASTVSDLGDGSSQAGIKELDNYFSKISPMQSQSNKRENKAQGGYIKAMVSNDEYEVDPSIVTSIGGGSNEKGAKILEKFIKEVRSKKRTSGEKLPPKSKPIGGYLKQISG